MIPLKNKIFSFRFLAGVLFSLYPVFIFSQQTQDSATADSINRANIRQAIANQKAVGQDTTALAKTLVSPNGDTPSKKTLRKTSDKERFCWNDAKFRSDTLNGKQVKRHSPLYAAMFSAAVPGLGQAYNKKYWKIPIVYAGFGGLGYALFYTASNFYGYRNAYRLEVDENPLTKGSYMGISSTGALKAYRDYFKKNMDITAICTGVWYALNIIDAAVDAHLFEWNMKDDLSVSWHPVAFPPTYSSAQAAGGVKLYLNF